MKIKSLIQLIFLLIVLQCQLFAQGETDNWIFGSNHYIKFVNDTPVIRGVYHYNLATPGYGSTTISNKVGELLFYTNGESIQRDYCAGNFTACLDWMDNGDSLSGLIWVPQNIIIPRPGYSDRYYNITPPWNGGPGWHAIRYSEVDMAANNGQGAVLNPKDVMLTMGTSQVTAAYHANGKDIWVITHLIGQNRFLAYLVTENGFPQFPVASDVGLIYSGAEHDLGEMKLSPNG